VKVNGLPTTTAIAIGASHACAVVGADSSVYCWGYDFNGQVGNGAPNTIGVPTSVTTPTKVGLNVTARAVAAGTDFSCALGGNGQVQCWGANNFGQLGTGTLPASPNDPGTPIPMFSAFNSNGAAIATDGAAQFACAITNTGGAKCWGLNSYGQLGDGTTSTIAQLGNPNPVDVVGLGALPSTIAVGFAHACGLSSAGTLYCWGNNAFGQLGTGSSVPNNPPSAAQATAPGAAGLSISGMALGANHTCILASDGTVWCFGSNAFGQLGNNTFIDSATPVQVVGW
jgi:alpha-tubulin suppressor-like RCC1 family protein